MARYQFKRSVNIDSVDDVKAFIDGARANDASKSNVVKIVIGPSPGDSTEGWDSQELARLADVEWNSFRNLTHLYLWSIAGLKRIGPLPAKLECLDLRGCRDLETLPADLPPALETLDLEGCAKLAALPKRLPTSLVEIYLQDCAKLRKFAPVRALLNHRLRREGKPGDAATGHGTEQRGLRRLVIHGAGFTEFDESSRGERGENIADSLLTTMRGRREQGTERIAECKLVLVGDGGAGKTSLIRALKGKPFRDEPATDRIRCWSWNGGHDFRPISGHPELSATINVWDFAGQQLYHSTHRMFLESRAVFLVVWRTPPPDGTPNRPEYPDDEHYDLNYWLDQIHAANKDPDVILVRTRCDEDETNPPDGEWASTLQPKYRHLARRWAFEVSAVDGKRESLAGLRAAIQKKIRKQLAPLEASTMARGWKAVRDSLAAMQPKWDDIDDDQRPAASDRSPIMRLHEFKNHVRQVYGTVDGAKTDDRALDRELAVLLRTLHDMGAVYCPRHWCDAWQTHPERQVVIDQRWAIDAVYALLANEGVRESLLRNNGVVSRRELDQHWMKAAGDAIEQKSYPQSFMPLPQQPEKLWAIEQLMLASGVMIRMPMNVEGQLLYSFPDKLQPLPRLRAALEEARLWPATGTSRRYRVSGYLGFDACFAGRMMERIKRVDPRAWLFRHGAVVFREAQRRDGEPAEQVAIVVEWHAPEKGRASFLSYEIAGNIARLGEGVVESGWSVARSWIDEGVEERGGKANVKIEAEYSPAPAGKAAKSDTIEQLTPPARLPIEPDQSQVQLAAPTATSIMVAVSYAGNEKEFPAIEELPGLICEKLKSRSSHAGIQVVQYRESKALHLPALIKQIVDGHLVLAVMSGKYVKSRYCMQEFYFCAVRDALEEPYGADGGWKRMTQAEHVAERFPLTSDPPWNQYLWVVKIPSENINDIHEGTLASAARQEAEREFQRAKRNNPGRGENVIRSEVYKTDGGNWLLVAHDLDPNEITPVFRSIKAFRVPSWSNAAGMSLDERAQRVVDDVVEQVNVLRAKSDPSRQFELLKRRSLSFFAQSKHDHAADAYEELVSLNPDVAADPELDGPRKVAQERRGRRGT